MPEGPEVRILSFALNEKFGNNISKSYGKILFTEYNDEALKWSFGIHGGINIDASNNLTKTFHGNICGDVLSYIDIEKEKARLGVDFFGITEEQIATIVNKWQTQKKKLGSLLLTQTDISGIGVAWGSEILASCNLHPNIKANEQNLEPLKAKIFAFSRNVNHHYYYIFRIYMRLNKLDEFINEWPAPLYSKRFMKVYKKGTKFLVTNRTWYIKNEATTTEQQQEEEEEEIDEGNNLFNTTTNLLNGEILYMDYSMLSQGY
jgi:formamidopyrimidine-DNA glycosylase